MNPLQRVGAEVLSVGLTLTAVVGCFAAQWFLWNGKPLSALAAIGRLAARATEAGR